MALLQEVQSSPSPKIGLPVSMIKARGGWKSPKVALLYTEVPASWQFRQIVTLLR